MVQLVGYREIKVCLCFLFSVLIAGVLCFDCYAADEGYITIKLKAQNLSPVKSQIISFKKYLPREITANDVTELGDLELEYDSAKDKYFIHKDFNLGVKEIKNVEVVIRDVWSPSREERETIKRKYNDSLESMKDVLSTDQIESFKSHFDSGVNKIEKKINSKSFSFDIELDKKREIKKMVSALNIDIAKLKNMKKEIEAAPPKTERAWNIMISIVVSMVVVSCSFFYLFFTKFNPYDSMAPKRNVTRIDDVVKKEE